ncbi:MAG: Mut7-C RNAse domain-containing protein [Methanobacteriota archaeon]|nr:MAG: Mut7-C RNAse domain-containing protein [Euryarchaeota archaeon]
MTEADARPRFVADGMLGSLARWLRMLGYDTAYEKDMRDETIISMAASENRHIITRDRELAKQPGSLMVESDDLEAQIKCVAERFQLTFDEKAIRCSACNGPLADLPKEEAAGVVPEGALESNEAFWRCSSCGKVYWKGSHWHGIMDRFRRLNLV